MRPYEPADQGAVLELINAYRIPGQPRVTPPMLDDALAGRSTIDSSFWGELDNLTTMVMPGGVVSFATRPRDGAGVILWLYGPEQPLIDAALGRLGRRTVVAFDFASALTCGLEALPVRHRASTRRALEAAGFKGSDDWRYIRRRLDQPWSVSEAPRVDIIECGDRPGWELMMRTTDDALLGEATIGEPVDGIGVLWWISVAPAFRGRGYGRALLGQAMTELAEQGAREIIAYVDDDAPPSAPERDRSTANRLYDSMGFEELDRLWSFARPA